MHVTAGATPVPRARRSLFLSTAAAQLTAQVARTRPVTWPARRQKIRGLLVGKERTCHLPGRRRRQRQSGTTKQYKSQSALKSELKQIIQINACSKPGAWGDEAAQQDGHIYLRLRRSKPTRSSNTGPRNRISSSSSAVGKPRTSPSIGYN